MSEGRQPQHKRKIRLSARTGVNTTRIGPDHAEVGGVAPDDDSTTLGAAAAAAAAPLPAQKKAKMAAPSPPEQKENGGTAGSSSARGRPWTVTVALPGSIVDNAQTHELRSQLVGQVARACAIFNVDEIVVFSSSDDGDPAPVNAAASASDSVADARAKKRTGGSVFMARLLQYLECPQYLRKHIFPLHPDLRGVGLLAPLDAPHHLRIDEACEYREGVVVPPGGAYAPRQGAAVDGGEQEPPAAAQSESSAVYTGLRKELKIGRQLPVGTRVTVRMPQAGSANARAATVVPPREPRESAGLYWGFEVRLARGLAAVWSECPHAGGYDLSIGTSEHGSAALHAPPSASSAPYALPPFRHLLIVFGGVEGLEPVVAAEEELADCDGDVAALFDEYLNLCPNQGSRTIRTEEALLVGLSALKPHIEKAGGAQGS